MKLIVTVDVEEDSGPGWVCPPTSSFAGVTRGLKQKLQPILDGLKIKPTLLISPIVLESDMACETLASMENVELGAHLHWEQSPPNATRTLTSGPRKSWAMQWDYPPEAEREKLTALTDLFEKRFGYRPTSFRAGRYGVSRSTGQILKDLGYLVDSSVTPHLQWPTAHGQYINYMDSPEMPYYIAESGLIFKEGLSDFLEVPITVVPGDQIPLPHLAKAVWFRPGPTYSRAQVLKEIIRYVRQRNMQGIEQPLVMMFHNVELVPGANPNTKTEDDVQRMILEMREALAYALSVGFEPCTLSEYAKMYPKELEKANLVKKDYDKDIEGGQRVSNGINIPYTEVRNAMDKHGAHSWHYGIYKGRSSRWDVMAISEWANSNIPTTASILSAGCGAGFNLYWLARNGFTDLSGFDINTPVIEASRELKEKHGFNIHLWVANMTDPEHGFFERFDYIEAMNCMMLAKGVYEPFLDAYVKALKPLGYMAFDVIDSDYDKVPNNEWHTAEWNLPIEQRRPTEYTVRYSQEETLEMAAKRGLQPVVIFYKPNVIPIRKIYVFRKIPEGYQDHVVPDDLVKIV